MKKIIEKIEAGAEERLNIVVLDLIALISSRVKNKGTTADGGYFTNYSEWHKSNRQEAGLQTSYKDFTFTNTMWRDFDLLQTTTTGSEIVSDVGFRTLRSAKIYDENVVREKREIIEPSGKEMETVADMFFEWILKQFD